jgi:hypothetical protein
LSTATCTIVIAHKLPYAGSQGNGIAKLVFIFLTKQQSMSGQSERIDPEPLGESSCSFKNLLSAEQVMHPSCGDAARAFLRRHGHTSLVSLGCGPVLNRLDNHVRLLTALNLECYVAIDCTSAIALGGPQVFMNFQKMTKMLREHFQEPQKFLEAVKVFPNTWVEDLAGIHCAVVVCQRVLPDCRWEEVISSMTPRLVLQEDLHGCERQQLRGLGYVRTWTKVRQYGLAPFRPWWIFPGERNLILWRRQDFCDPEVRDSKWRALWRLGERLIG